MKERINDFLDKHFYEFESIGQVLTTFLAGILFAVSIMSLMK